jgi:hypothetical protein
VERGGEVRATRLGTAEADETEAHVRADVEPGSIAMADELEGYAKLGKTSLHFAVNRKQGESVSGEFCRANTVENLRSLFRRSVIGIHHHVSDEHINRYLDRAACRYGSRLEGEGARVAHLSAGVSGKRLKYKDPLAWQMRSASGLTRTFLERWSASSWPLRKGLPKQGSKLKKAAEEVDQHAEERQESIRKGARRSKNGFRPWFSPR